MKDIEITITSEIMVINNVHSVTIDYTRANGNRNAGRVTISDMDKETDIWAGNIDEFYELLSILNSAAENI